MQTDPGLMCSQWDRREEKAQEPYFWAGDDITVQMGLSLISAAAVCAIMESTSRL